MLHLGMTRLGEPGSSRLALLSLVIKSPPSETQSISENWLINKALDWWGGAAERLILRSEAGRQ